MARILIAASLTSYTGGVAELEIDAPNVFELFETLAKRFPDLGQILETEVAIAIDGEVYQDALLQPIRRDSEVILFNGIAGG